MMGRTLATLLLLIWTTSAAVAQALSVIEAIDVPTGKGAREPSLFADTSGRLIMSWTEEAHDGFAVKTAFLEDGVWSEPSTVTSSTDLFVNWADFPSIALFDDGTMVTHWLQKAPGGLFSYDVKIALSRDDGRSWSVPITPHRDGTSSQHGFVTLAPFRNDVIAIWLDGRAYGGELLEQGAVSGAMQLRAAVISTDGTMSQDAAIDFMTCSCCQTSAAIAGDTLLVLYRDRSNQEIRDISVIRMRDGVWSDPATIHADGWEISGCPVNGPSISAHGDSVATAWFTGANDIPAIKMAFSSDAGHTFGDAVRIDQGQPVGRVDTLMLEDESALVSWIEWIGSDETLFICRATAEGCVESQVVTRNSSVGSMNFPQMAATRDTIYLAWTHPLSNGKDSIRLVKLAR